MIRKTLHRRGVTLTEVLIAILLMAIGMISLLALFPVGIANILQATRDNRVAKYAANAEAIAELGNIRRDPTVFLALENRVLPNPQLPIGFDDPSVPVWVHPLDMNDLGATPPAIGEQGLILTKALNGNPNLPWKGIPRSGIAPSSELSKLPLSRWFEQTDDATYTKSGEGVYPSEDEKKYSWCYVCRRPRYRDRELVELTVVVFVNRKPTALGGGFVTGEVTLGGPGLGLVFTKDSTTATIAYRATDPTPPAVRRGFWLFDATVGREPGTNKFLSNAYFYRVLDVSDPYPNPNNANEMLMDIQMATPARENGYVCVLLTGVADVIEKGVGRTPR